MIYASSKKKNGNFSECFYLGILEGKTFGRQVQIKW
jgi:hypothetical protein